MSLTIQPGAIVCNESQLIGDISIGTRTVVHPKAQIIAEAGPIIIGENNLIEERAKIINAKDPNATSETSRVMIIGNNNVFEVDCKSYALKIGDFNTLESKSVVGRSLELTNGCIIGAGCQLLTSEMLPENCVVYGAKNDRRIQADRPAPQALQIEYLSKVLPNYHHLKKPASGAKK
jgi:dynactin-6